MTAADTQTSTLKIDESARPSMPPIEGATSAHRAKGQHLALIHNGYRRDLALIAQVLRQIEGGEATPEDLHRVILGTDMRQNLRDFGNLCGQGCKVLQFHHAMEEGHMFPGLEAPANGALRAVVAQLRKEHDVVHTLLDMLEAAASDLVAEPADDTLAQAGHLFQQLDDVIRSHFKYEESELEEAIGFYLDGI